MGYEYKRPTDAIKPITAIGIEWWTVQKDASIDNIVIGRSRRSLDEFARATAMVKSEEEMRLFMQMMSGQQGPSGDIEAPTLKPWKFVATGAFIVGIFVLILVLRRCAP